MFLATLAPLSVSAENEAEKKTNEVMQLVFTYVERNGFQPRTYESEIYQRHRMYTKRKGIIARYVPGACATISLKQKFTCAFATRERQISR